MARYFTFSQWAIFVILSCTTLVGGLIYLGFVAVTYRQDRADPVHGPKIREQEAAKDAAAAIGREQNLFAFKACAAVLAAVAMLGLVCGAITGSDSAAGPTVSSAVGAPSKAAVSDGCDLAGAIPDCKRVLAAQRP